jgi:uncharacterized protein HemX
MCMSCSTGRITKKKIAIFSSSIGVLIVVGTYFAFITTNNPAVAAAVPALLSFAACPAMCVAVGGIMWLSTRFSRNKNKDNNNTSIGTTKGKESCRSGISDLNNKKQSQQSGIEVLESKHEKDRTSILQQKQQVKFKN